MTKQTEKKASPAAGLPAEDWHPSDVVAALHKAGWTLKALAEEHGLTTSSTFSRAMTTSYPLAEKRIADALDLHPMQIWPSRYLSNGDVKPRGFRGLKFKRFAPGVNVKDQRLREHGKA